MPLWTFLSSHREAERFAQLVELRSLLIGGWSWRYNSIFSKVRPLSKPYATMSFREWGRWWVVEGFFASECQQTYSGFGFPNLLDFGKAWVILAGELFARCFLICSLVARENFFMLAQIILFYKESTRIYVCLKTTFTEKIECHRYFSSQ